MPGPCPAFAICGHIHPRQSAYTKHLLACIAYKNQVTGIVEENMAIVAHAEKKQRLDEAGTSAVSLHLLAA
jgi:hypothetical protein